MRTPKSIAQVFIMMELVLLPLKTTAQDFTVVHAFPPGQVPVAGLALADKLLFGTTALVSGGGSIFAVNIGGTGFTTLHAFTGTDYQAGDLICSSNIIYGTTVSGGDFGFGSVFKVNTDGTGFVTLHSFNAIAAVNPEGAQPYNRLVLSSNVLYGATYAGGTTNNGTVFAVNTDGTGYRTLHSFTEMGYFPGSETNIDGARPTSSLVLSGNTLYGTTLLGGTDKYGTVFSLETDGTGFTPLYNFKTGGLSGVYPHAGLVLSSDTLYGTRVWGGTWGNGIVYKLKTDGTAFSTLYNFTAGEASGLLPTNLDGITPSALTIVGNTLYGTAQFGGSSGNGTAFAIPIDGTVFTNLHNFFPDTDGANPTAGLISSGNTLYGISSGTVFAIKLPVSAVTPAIARAKANLILTWPTNATGVVLQSTTNLALPVWTTNLPTPVVLNGQFTVTNPISGAQQFFRLSQ